MSGLRDRAREGTKRTLSFIVKLPKLRSWVEDAMRAGYLDLGVVFEDHTEAAILLRTSMVLLSCNQVIVRNGRN